MGILKPTGFPVQTPDIDAIFGRAVKLFASDTRYMNDSQELRIGA